MANPRELVEAERTLPAHQDKNAIINGSFQINQREDIDTAPVAIVNTDYKIDRHRESLIGVTGTIQRKISQLVNGRYENTIICIATSSAVGTIGTEQPIENFHLGQTITFGVWAKSNSVNCRPVIFGDTTVVGSGHSGGGGWEFLTVTATIANTATRLRPILRLVDSGGGQVAITSGDYIESTMWQLENGVRATPFEQRSIGEELNLCQRYYEKYNFWRGAQNYAYEYKQEKRVIPTMTSSATLSEITNHGFIMNSGAGSYFYVEADAEL